MTPPLPVTLNELADRLTAIVESRMSRDLAWLRDDGKTVDRFGPEKVGWALAHLYLTGDVVSGLPPLAAQPAPPAEALRLLRLLAFDDEPCRYDHHGHCQAHGFLDGDYRNTGCPMAEARRYLAATEEGTP